MNSSASPRRVVITGMGHISPLGNSLDALWDALSAGRSGVGTINRVPADALPTSYAAEASEFEGKIDSFGPLEKSKKKLVRKNLKVMCRETQMGVAASQLALGDAGMDDAGWDPERVGVIFGSDYMMTRPDDFKESVEKCVDENGLFDFSRWGTDGLALLEPLWLLKYLPNMPASHVAIFNDLRGPNNSITQREASSNLAIGEAYCIIQRGSADVLVAGSTGTRVHPMRAVHTCLQEELAQNGAGPVGASRPFDLNRTGLVLGEGAGAIVLEELKIAIARGARIYGEIVGYGSSTVADRHMVAHCDKALANVLAGALRTAGLEPQQLGHIHAHGLSTRASDINESAAIQQTLGDSADKIPVTAGKSYFGNLGAGGGTVELICSTLALDRGQLFPILNYQTPDPECPIRATTEFGDDPGETFVNLSVTPQGQASSILVKKFVGE